MAIVRSLNLEPELLSLLAFSMALCTLESRSGNKLTSYFSSRDDPVYQLSNFNHYEHVCCVLQVGMHDNHGSCWTIGNRLLWKHHYMVSTLAALVPAVSAVKSLL